MRFVWGFSNVQNTPDLPRPKVVRVARLMRRAIRKYGMRSVAGFCEIREREDVEDMRIGMGIFYRWTLTQVTVPIAFKRSQWKLLSSNVTVLHDSNSKIPTPRRFMTEMVVKPRWRRKAKPMVFLYTHLINGGYNGKHPRTEAERRLLWERSIAVVADAVRRFHASGFDVFLAGDFNRRDLPSFGIKATYVFDSGIDKMLAFMQPGHQLIIHRKQRVETPSDHRGLVADIEVKEQS